MTLATIYNYFGTCWTNDIRRVWKISQNGKSLGDDEYTCTAEFYKQFFSLLGFGTL